MNKVILHAASLLILGIPLSLHAQDAKIPPPTPPFLNRTPDHTTWKVTYTPKRATSSAAQTPSSPASAGTTNDGASPASPLASHPLTLMEMDVIKMSPNRQEVSLWSDKQTTERWGYNGLSLFDQHGNPYVYVFPFATENETAPVLVAGYSKSDFPELSWVNLENYKGVVTYLQHSCYLFQSPQPMPPEFKLPADQIPLRQAWIDVKTKLPVAFDDGATTSAYTGFKEIPSRELVLPPAFAKALEDFQKNYALNYGHPWKP